MCQASRVSDQSKLEHFATPLGNLTASFSSCGLHSLTFTSDNNFGGKPKPPTGKPELAELLCDFIEEYFSRGSFNSILHGQLISQLDWSNVTPFQKKALIACSQIPCGESRSYGQLATEIGNPNAARAVGSAMSKNRWLLLIPCHRVLGSSGAMHGYSGGQGVSTKQWLLAHERNAVQDELLAK